MKPLADTAIPDMSATPSSPGTVIYVDPNAVYVSTGDGVLRIDALQLEGKKRMSTHDFLLGQKVRVSDRLGSL